MNSEMKPFRFYHPIEVRYADIDAQRHVNSSRYFTYMEQARARYIRQLGLWEGRDFDAIGIILAEQSCRYLQPITFEQSIRVGVRTERMGNKSIEMAYVIERVPDGEAMAIGRTILVAYDYQQNRSILVPQRWREAAAAFEGWD